MSPIRSIIRSVPLLVLVFAAMAAPPGTTTDALTIYHAFAAGRSGEWVTVTVPVDGAAWRVDRPDGPAATRAQVDDVLASLRLVIVGASCRGTSEGPTHRPCSVELALPTERGALPIANTWESLNGDLLTRYDGRGSPSSVLASSNPPGRRVPFAESRPAAPSPLEPDESFVGLYAAHDFASGSAGALRFRIRVHTESPAARHAALVRGLLIVSNKTPSASATATPPATRPGAPA